MFVRSFVHNDSFQLQALSSMTQTAHRLFSRNLVRVTLKDLIVIAHAQIRTSMSGFRRSVSVFACFRIALPEYMACKLIPVIKAGCVTAKLHTGLYYMRFTFFTCRHRFRKRHGFYFFKNRLLKSDFKYAVICFYHFIVIT